MSPRIVIIGAGLSGLYAAHLLERQGHEALVLEARSRIGGRIHGVAALGDGHRFDLGPAWLWPAINPRLKALASALGLRLFEQHSQGASLAELQGQGLRRYPAGQAQGPASMRVEGGLSRLVDSLAARLERTELQLDCAVTALQQTASGSIAIEFEHAGARQRVNAHLVIAALPPRLLSASIAWTPALPSDVQRALKRVPTWMAAQAKLLAVYPCAFWRDDGLSGEAMSQRGPLVEIHDASDAQGQRAALFGFVGVPAAQRQRIDASVLTERCVAQLVRLFGPQAAQPLWVGLQDWSTDRWTAVPEDSRSTAGHPDQGAPALPPSWAQTVLWAGTEVAEQYGGYLEGALEAAESAVAQVASRLNIHIL